MKSSNIGAAKLGVCLGDEKFYEYIRRFGFGERTGVELPGEIGGLIRPPQVWSKISMTRIPMGHEIGVTALQMTTAMAAIANGGKLVMPHVVKSITTADGKTITNLAPVVVRQIVSPQTAQQIGNSLARSGERPRDGGGGGGSRFYDCRKNRHRPEARSPRPLRAWQIRRLVSAVIFRRTIRNLSAWLCWTTPRPANRN